MQSHMCMLCLQEVMKFYYETLQEDENIENDAQAATSPVHCLEGNMGLQTAADTLLRIKRTRLNVPTCQLPWRLHARRFKPDLQLWA